MLSTQEDGAVNAELVLGGRGCDYELWTCRAGNAGSLTVSSPLPFFPPHLLHLNKRSQVYSSGLSPPVPQVDSGGLSPPVPQVDSGGLIPPVPQSSGQRRFESLCATVGQWRFD